MNTWSQFIFTSAYLQIYTLLSHQSGRFDLFGFGGIKLLHKRGEVRAFDFTGKSDHAVFYISFYSGVVFDGITDSSSQCIVNSNFRSAGGRNNDRNCYGSIVYYLFQFLLRL